MGFLFHFLQSDPYALDRASGRPTGFLRSPFFPSNALPHDARMFWGFCLAVFLPKEAGWARTGSLPLTYGPLVFLGVPSLLATAPATGPQMKSSMNTDTWCGIGLSIIGMA